MKKRRRKRGRKEIATKEKKRGGARGRSDPKYVGVDSCWELDCFAQRKHVVFRKEWYCKTGKEVMEGRPLLHHLLGSRM